MKKNKLICINIGHGPKDGGAYNPHYKLNEYTYNHDVAIILQEKLDILGFDSVIVTQSVGGVKDSFGLLYKSVNDTGCDLCISLHANCDDGDATGSEVVYLNGSSRSKILAMKILNRIVPVFGLPNRGLKPIPKTGRGGSLLYKTTMPCVIVEPFFIDNNHDCAIGLNKVNKYADSLSKAVEDYFL
jgi:N-acetylmuramoyl-L-alanine amidase